MILKSIEAVAHKNPDAMALRFEDKAFTYGGLVREVYRIANVLRARGLSNTSTLAVYCENSSDILVLYYAMAKLGGTFVPINAGLSSAEVAYILEHAHAKLLLTDEKLTANANEAASGLDCQVYQATDFFVATPVLETISAEETPSAHFLIIYTSGSTGIPKAVLFDQKAETAGNQSLIDMWQISPADKMLVALPLGFLYGLSTAAATGIQAGCEVVVLRRFRPQDVLEAIIHHGITVFQGVPTMFSMMVEYAEQNSLHFDLSGVRLLISAGAPLPMELRQRFTARFGAEIQDYYALTEVRPVFGKFAADHDPVPAGAIGKSSPGVEIKVVSSSGAVLPANVTGEIMVRAPATTSGYLNAQALTEASFDNGFFRTGDLGHFDTRGYFYLTGRIKDIIIRGGANIAPAEVEGVLLTHQDIQSCGVIGVDDQKFGELPVAFYVSRTNHPVNTQALTDHCRHVLADFKVPAHFVHLYEMPLGNTGKIDKKALSSYWKGTQNV